jgi:hypothetical protein
MLATDLISNLKGYVFASKCLFEDSSFVSAIWGAVLGALVAGFISWWLQRQEFKRQNKIDIELSKRKDAALMVSLISKTQKIVSTYANLLNEFKASSILAQKEGDGDLSSEYFKSLLNFPEQIVISIDELSFFLMDGYNPLYNDLFGLDHMHNGVIDALRYYSTERSSLFDLTRIENVDKDGRVKSVVSENVNKFVAMKGNLDRTLLSIRDTCAIELIKSYGLFLGIVGEYNRIFEKKLQIHMPAVSEMVEKLTTKPPPPSAPTPPHPQTSQP